MTRLNNFKHFSIGAIHVFCNMLFSCCSGSSWKVHRKTAEDLLHFHDHSFITFFLPRMHSSRVPEGPIRYPEGSWKQLSPESSQKVRGRFAEGSQK